METVFNHCNEHLLKYLSVDSLCALSAVSKSFDCFVKQRDEIWKQRVPAGMPPFSTGKQAVYSIGRASNMLHSRSVASCDIASSRVLHVTEHNRKFFVVTQSLCVYVSDDRDCHQFYWYGNCCSGTGSVLSVASCGSDLFASSIYGVRWLSLDLPGHANSWSGHTLPFPISRVSVEVQGHAFMLLTNGTVGYYQYSNLGTGREHTYFTIRPVHTSATHVVAMPKGDECMVGCTDNYVEKMGMESHTEVLSIYSEAGGGDSIESMVLIKPSGNVAVLFKNFHLCIVTADCMSIRLVGLVPFCQTLPVCMVTHGNNVHVLPYCQQFTYSDGKDELKMTNPLHGRVITSCVISQDCSTAVLSCVAGQIFAVPLTH